MYKSQTNYEFLMSTMGEEIRDIHYFAFIRNPVIKQASFSVLRALIPTVVMQNLTKAISNNVFPLVSIKIYGNDSIETDVDTRRKKLFYSVDLECINIRQMTSKAVEQKVPVFITLINPIFRFLENNHTFNQIIKNKTAYDALKAYESFLKDNFGDVFYFKHINPEVNKNTFKYEHILTRAANDINIPTYIIQTYKTHHNYCYYFFDDFYLSEDTTKYMTCHFSNLFDKKGLKQVDASVFSDAYHSTKNVSEYPFNDRMNVLDKSDQVNIGSSKELNYFHKKLNTSKILKGSTTGTDKIKIEDKRTITNLSAGNTSVGSISSGGAFSRSYIPDDPDIAETRRNISKQFVVNTIEKTAVFEISYCSPDYPQFGSIYNLDSNNLSEFLYTPLSICNMFNRKNENEEYLNHSSKVLMLKYASEKK